MFRDKKVVVVMPAYNAAKTLVQTYNEVMAQGMVDRVIIVDDASRDETVAVAKTLPNAILFSHARNLGYGETKRVATAWRWRRGRTSHHGASRFPVHAEADSGDGVADRLGLYPCVLGSRILGGYALRGGMPLVVIRGQPVSDGRREPAAGGQAFRVSHRLPGLFAADRWNGCRWRPIRTILCSTTRCWPRFCGPASRLRRSVARRGISPRPPRSTSAAA